jgi:hypothetical protein
MSVESDFDLVSDTLIQLDMNGDCDCRHAKAALANLRADYFALQAERDELLQDRRKT